MTANNLILGSSFSLNFNSQESIFDENFYQLRWKLDWVGSVLNQILNGLNGEEDAEGNNVFGGVSPSQYVKTELDFIKHWQLARETCIAFMPFGGIAFPLEMPTTCPFPFLFFWRFQ